MVIPRSRSRAFESMTQSVTSWFDRKAPDCRSRKSTRVVLPWSTWAMIAIFLRSMWAGEYSRAAGRMQPWPGTSPGRLSLLVVEFQKLAKLDFHLELGRAVPLETENRIGQRGRDEDSLRSKILPLVVGQVQEHKE